MTGSLPLSQSLHGSIVALVTPMLDGKSLDVNYEKLEELVQFHASSGTAAIVPCGTTGESPTLSHEEHDTVIETVVAAAKPHGLPVIAGTGSNSTREAVTLTAHAKEIGADACLIVAPYYNKPSPQGLIAHFKELDAIGIPLIVYNIPGRCGINISPDTVLQIAESCPNVVGLKASNGDLDEITEVAIRAAALNRPLSILSGDDSLTLPILSVGGVGVISVLANVLPKEMATLVKRWHNGDIAGAQRIAHAIHGVARTLLKIGPNPAPIKALMNYLGLAVGECRLPLVPISESGLSELVRQFAQLRSFLDEDFS